MTLASYEKTTRTLAILIMISGMIMWFYVFRSFIVLAIEFDADLGITDIIRSFYPQLLQITAEIIGIILLLALRKKGLPIILGVCAVIIAVECLLDAYLLLVEYKNLLPDERSLVDFIEGALSLIIAIMLLFNAIMYSIGVTKSASLIKYAVITLILLQVFGFIVELRDPDLSLNLIITAREFEIPSYVMLFLVLHMSMSKYTRQISPIGVVKTSISGLRNSLMVEGVGIGRDIAHRFADYNENGLWCDTYSFMLTTFNKGRLSMEVTHFEGKAVCRISSVENGSGLNIFRFDLTGVWFDTGYVGTCDIMRFYGTDGMFVQLIVRDPPVFKPAKVPKFGSFKLTSREEGTTSHKISMKVKQVKDFLARHLSKLKNFIRTEVIGRIKKKKE